MKYALYGNDIDESTNTLEAGLGWITKLEKSNFIGKEVLTNTNNSLKRKLVCIKMIDRGIPRKGYKLFLGDEEVGEVTSGTQSPSLNEGIGLAYVSVPHEKFRTELNIKIRYIFLDCIVVKPPFYKNGSLNK